MYYILLFANLRLWNSIVIDNANESLSINNDHREKSIRGMSRKLNERQNKIFEAEGLFKDIQYKYG